MGKDRSEVNEGNPKLESRNPKEIGMLKEEKSETILPGRLGLGDCIFGFHSDFGFRNSDFPRSG
jgi:hypothetical protein